MKLSSEAVEQTLTQFEAEPLPDNHPAVAQLNQIFGDHTYFLDGTGLHIVELTEATELRLTARRGGEARELERREPHQSGAASAGADRHGDRAQGGLIRSAPDYFGTRST